MSVLIAVDTNVLYDEEWGDEDVPDSLQTIRERLKGPRIIVPPTVLHELAFAADHSEEPKKSAALAILGNLLHRGYEPHNLIPAGHGIVEQISLKLRLKEVIPDEEVNDSLIIAEAALMGATILLSSDSHMLTAQKCGRLNNVLAECDVEGDGMIIASPRSIVRQFYR